MCVLYLTMLDIFSRIILMFDEFVMTELLGTKTGHKRPIVKILKVEDLKNDDIVERIKRELGQHLSLKLESSASKLVGPNELTKKSTECFRSSDCTLTEDPESSITTGDSKISINEETMPSDCNQNSVVHTKDSTTAISCNNEQYKSAPEGGKKIKVDPDSKELMKPPEKESSYIVLNRKLHFERMKRFISMSKSDIPPKTDRKFKCEGPISELKAPVDTIRCSKCGVLYESDILVAHLKKCQGDKRKTKYGCRLCSFTDCDYRQLEGHIRSVHPKRSKK